MEKPHPFFFPSLLAIGVVACASIWFLLKPSNKELSRLVPATVKAQYLPDAAGRLPANTVKADKMLATSMTPVSGDAPVVAAKKAP